MSNSKPKRTSPMVKVYSDGPARTFETEDDIDGFYLEMLEIVDGHPALEAKVRASWARTIGRW